MGFLYASYEYTRAAIGEAILEASQFAHVPEAGVWDLLDGMADTISRPARVRGGDEDRTTYWVRAYDAANTLNAFETEYGSLCPICLCPVPPVSWQERIHRRHSYHGYPGALAMYRDFHHFVCHPECAPIDTAIWWIQGSYLPDQGRGLMMIKRRNFFSPIHEAMDRYGAPPLRFNVRCNSEVGPKTYPRLSAWGSIITDADIVETIAA